MTDSELFKDLKRVKMEDYKLLKSYFMMANYQESNHNVVNLYMWNGVYPLWYHEGNGWLIMVGKHNGEYFLYMPLCKTGCFFEAINMGEELFTKHNIPYVLSCYTEEAKDNILAINKNFVAEEIRDGFDYIYEYEKLSTFTGKKLQKKRNHINAFLKEQAGHYKYSTLTSVDINECLAYLDEWESGESDSFLMDECNGVRFLLKNFDQMDYVGGLIRIDGKIQALTIGSYLNNNTVQVNVEKANANIRGLYPFLTREYLAHEWADKGVVWVNREDDIGLDYLRQAKLSLYPEYLLKKYRLHSKGE